MKAPHTPLVLLILLLTPFTYANIFGSDDREPREREAGSLYAPIGAVVNMQTRRGGTAFLIGTQHILTSYSAVMNQNEELSEAEYIRFGVGPGGAKRFARFSTARPVVWGEYKSDDLKNPEGDWALLELQEPLGLEFGFLKLKEQKLTDAARKSGLQVAGHPQDREMNQIWVDRECALISDPFLSFWLHTCATRPGNAGSPLLIVAGENPLSTVVVALHLGSIHEVPEILPQYSPDHANYALPVEQFLAKIAPHVPELNP